MPDHKKHSVFNQRSELVGNRLPRQFRHWVRMKTKVSGNFDTGPGLKNLIILWVIHYLGKPIFWMRTWLQNQTKYKYRAKQKLNSLKSRRN